MGVNMMRSFKVYFLSFLVIFILLSTTTAFGGDPGDINNDGTVDLADGVLPLPILSGQPTDGLNINISADVNGDGLIGFQEAAFALQWAAELRGGQPNSDATLSGLTFCCGTLTPSFHPDTLTYTITVPTDTDQVTLTAMTQETSALVMINSTLVTSGKPCPPISLVEGENDPIIILVMAEDGSTTKVYQLIVTRGEAPELATNAFLSGLVLSDASLNESFFPVLFNYSAIVANNLNSIRITPETDDPDATLTINGAAAVSGQPSLPINLLEGENRISVEVTAQDPGVTQTYSIIVTREGTGSSSNANLSGITLSETHLTTPFTPGILTYTANVLNYVEHIAVSPTAANPSAAITINGNPLVSGQPSPPIDLVIGDNLIAVTVAAQDGTLQTYTINIARHGAPTGVAATVYVVDAPASLPHEFETLPAALEYLSTNLTPDQLGEIRIQTTQPMAVDALNFSCNIIITLDPGAATTIIGPGTSPLAINAGGSFDISGLNFVNLAGFVINSSVGLAATGSNFSADTLINVGSYATSLSARSDLAVRSTAGTGFVSKDLSFNEGQISGGLNVSAAGATQKNIEVTNTQASFMGVSGTFTESSYLNLKANLIPELNINLDLRNDSKLDIAGHTGLNYTSSTINMEGNATANLKSNTIAKLEAEYTGFKGIVQFENTFIGDAAILLNTKELDFTGNNLNSNTLKIEMSKTVDASTCGINFDGLFVNTSLFLNAPSLPLEASLTAGIKNLKANGSVDLFLSGRAVLTLDTVRIGGEATFKYGLGSGDVKVDKTEFLGKVFVQSLDNAFEFNGSYNHVQFHNDAIWDFASANVIIRFGSNEEAPVEIDESHHIWIKGSSEGVGGLRTPLRSTLAGTEGEIHINNLNVKGSSGKPGLMIEGVDVPVTIENSQITSDQWAIVLRDVDGAVIIRDNQNIEGGIFLDGDPDVAGTMIDKQYTLSANTISHSTPGMSCIQTHAIHDVLIENTDMTATGDYANGVLVSGGRVTIKKGSILTSGPEKCQAIGVGESAGGHTGIVYAEELSLITGAVQTGPQGYIKLTGNTFSNAKVIDYKEGLEAYPRLLNDPMGNDNAGLDPDEDIIGSLTDWDDDEHNCPDYPTKCNEWDDEEKKCGCREDGVDPPSDPGV
jgi:hypothetical protein